MNQPKLESMLPKETFEGRVIVVTGGGTGLGKSMAGYFAQLGAKVVVCGRRGEVARKTAEEIASRTGQDALGLACDVRQPEQVERLVHETWDRFGAAHALVNNAAGNFICPTERLSPNAFRAVVEIVLMGTSNCTLAFGKRWIAEKIPGTLLNIVATYAWSGSGYVAPSAAAKAGVLALTRSLASEWGKYGIRSNAIAPGPFPTEGAWSRLMPTTLQGSFDPSKRIPLGRVGEHQELANLSAYLLSDYSAYINGACMVIDGGEWLRGAGEFNWLEDVTPDMWDKLQAEMKPAKPRDGRKKDEPGDRPI